MRTRPIYHSCDEAIRGHVCWSFLALVLRKELDSRCRKADWRPEWGDVLRDLDRLQQGSIETAGKIWSVRTEASGTVPALFKLVGIALPPRLQAIPPPHREQLKPTTPKRQGRPRRSATRP